VRRWMAGLAAVLLALSMAAGAMANSSDNAGHRVALKINRAKSLGIEVRNTLAGDRVSVHITSAQLKALRRLGVEVEIIPVRYVTAPPEGKGPGTSPGNGGGGGGGNGGGGGKPGSGKPTRVSPSSQTPYGVKMMYGDPILTAAGISGGDGIKVAILDTGSVDHPDFTRADGSKVIIECIDFTGKKAGAVQGSCKDGHGHGTHITGSLAAVGGQDGLGIWGVAPQTSVLSYKVVSDNGRGYSDDISRGIRLAADQGANIISLSLGSTIPSVDELDAIRYAIEKGVLVIAAAGNFGPNSDTIAYPAGHPEVMAVAALDQNETVTYFSGRGLTDGDDAVVSARELEVSAPGRSVISTNRDNGYRTMSGTSMAAPHIAGLAAKMWQGSADRTREWLIEAAMAHDILQAQEQNQSGPGYDIASGYGLPQVQTAIQSYWEN